ncbi:MAG: hypothetical protein Q9195_006776 [Heterodermia aff. obscurata]
MGLSCAKKSPDCTLYLQGQDCGKYIADPDIAGIGIIIAFVSTSLANLFIVFVAHLLTILRGYDNNSIDGWVFHHLQKTSRIRISSERKQFWRPIIERLVLLLSDYQLLFGIAILIAGFWKHCSISVYHFSIVVDLAWFSNTHMTSLSVLTCYLQERKTLRNWRVCIMIFMLIMMLVALVLASDVGWAMSKTCPAQCLFNDRDKNFAYTNPYVVALVLHYATSIWRVFDTSPLDEYLLRRPRATLRCIVQSSKRQDSNFSDRGNFQWQGAPTMKRLRYWLFMIIIRLYLLVAAIFGSLTISLYYDILWFSLGLIGILWGRNIPESDMIGDEHQLSFGQIVPMLMLASMVLSFKEVYTEQKLKSVGNDLERGQIIELASQDAFQPQGDLHGITGAREVTETDRGGRLWSVRVPEEKDKISHEQQKI